MSDSEALLSIGQFARKTRLSMKALRLYVRIGLLATARLIVELRRLDMPLNQVAEVFAAAGPNVAEIGRLRTEQRPATQSAAAVVAEYWDAVERRNLRDLPRRGEPGQRRARRGLRPQILSAFDAVFEWLTAKGRAPGGAPREVYFTDFTAAKPTDEVCDVAVPT